MNLRTMLKQLPLPPIGRTGWPWDVETSISVHEHIVWPRITIVIPSYQQGAFIEEALRSVLLQNYPNLEFIVNDGGSTDGTAELIDRYSTFLSHSQSHKDGGQGDAINQGFDRATGEILGWLNSDDLYLPGAFFAVAQQFASSTADIVYGDAVNLFEEEEGKLLQYWQGYWIRRSFLQYGGLFSSHAIFWRRKIHVRIWDELNCNIDGELWQRLVPNRRLRYLALPLGVCRIYAQTKSNASGWRLKWAEDDALIWQRHGKPSVGALSRRWFSLSQRVFKWVTYYRNVAAKRAVLAACDWPRVSWRGLPPP